MCTEHTYEFEMVPLKHAEHAHQELMRTLRVCIRN